MKIHNEFRIPLPREQAWEVLNDVPRVANCVPGAQLLEQTEDGAYVGTVALRLGPVALSFKGKFAYKEVDDANYRVKAEANGNEQRARGTARAFVEFVLEPDGDGTRVSVDTDVQLAGSIAQYARGGTLIETTAQVLMDQFAANLEAQLRETSASAAAGQSVSGTDEAAAGQRQSIPQATAQKAAAPKEISALNLMFQSLRYAMRRWFRNTFARKS